MLHAPDDPAASRASDIEPLPIDRRPVNALMSVRFVLTDVDDTLTLDGRLPAAAYAALENLDRAGITVVPVTGRPAGWCDLIARLWPVAGVVGENGAFYFRYDHASRRMVRRFSDDLRHEENAMRLARLARDIMRQVPGAALSADQQFRIADVAVDFAEDVTPLPASSIRKIVAAFADAGATAKVSSIHVNAWFGGYDKLTMSRQLLEEVFGFDLEAARNEVAYLGDSPNDEPMFAAFPLSVGVANVVPYLASMKNPPRYITRAPGGAGFAEFAGILLRDLDKSRRD